MSRPSTGAATPAAPVGGEAVAPVEGTGTLTGINKLGYGINTGSINVHSML